MLFGRKKRRLARVLVLEDEPLVAFDTEHFLGAEGFEIVATLDSVQAGLATVAGDAAIDLVVLDVNLADGNGIDVARAAHGRGIPVLYVTGACPEGARLYAAGCLSKPYPQRALLNAIEAIEAVIDGGRPPKRLPAGFSLFASAA